jgi:predicted amidophosphoribosyltransferase
MTRDGPTWEELTSEPTDTDEGECDVCGDELPRRDNGMCGSCVRAFDDAVTRHIEDTREFYDTVGGDGE